MSFSDKTMKAVTFGGPYVINVVQKPIPVADEGEVVVRVQLSSLCGSDLHQFRGHDPAKPDSPFTMGHEMVGKISECHPSVKDFKVGDLVVAPFTISCGKCFFCVRGFTGRCEKSRLFGCERLEGAQAEYVRVPMAESTLIHAPQDMPAEHLLMMADIFPTGCIVVKNAWEMMADAEKENAVAVVIGCGPVGLCAIMAATERFSKVFAIDPVADRLEMAKKYGAIPIPVGEDPAAFMSSATDSRGPDVVLEVVGNPQALDLGISLVRACGIVSSCGVHTAMLNIAGPTAYGKGIRMQFGRCHARAMFDESLVLLQKISRERRELLDDFVQKRIKLDEAPEYYALFEQRKIGKVIFDLSL